MASGRIRALMVLMMMEYLLIIVILVEEAEANYDDIAPSPSPFPDHFSELDELRGQGPLSVCLTNKLELACTRYLRRGPYDLILYDLCVIHGLVSCMSHLGALDDPIYITMERCVHDCETEIEMRSRVKCILKCYEHHIKVHSHDVNRRS